MIEHNNDEIARVKAQQLGTSMRYANLHRGEKEIRRRGSKIHKYILDILNYIRRTTRSSTSDKRTTIKYVFDYKYILGESAAELDKRLSIDLVYISIELQEDAFKEEKNRLESTIPSSYFRTNKRTTRTD